MVISRFFIETMSKNNTIRKSDKKFIRTEKSRIRRQFSDFKKQEEMINKLYERFSGAVKTEEKKMCRFKKLNLKSPKLRNRPKLKK